MRVRPGRRGTICTRSDHRLRAACIGALLAGCTGQLAGGPIPGGEPEGVAADVAVAEVAPADPFRGAGLFVWQAAAFRAADHAERVRALGFDFVAVFVHDGDAPFDGNEGELASGWVDAWHEAGLRVGGWGVSRFSPDVEASVAADAVDRYGLDLYVVRAEPDLRDGAASFAGAFRARHPELPAGVLAEGRVEPTVDWAAFRDAGFSILPMAFANEDEVYDPVSCVSSAETAGFSLDQIHPALGLWGGGARGPVSAATYLARLAEAGTTGFTVYVAESMPESDWSSFRGAVR